MFICMLLFFHQCEVVGYNRGLLGIVVGTDAGWLVVANVQPWPWLVGGRWSVYVFRVMAIFNLVVSLPPRRPEKCP